MTGCEFELVMLCITGLLPFAGLAALCYIVKQAG